MQDQPLVYSTATWTWEDKPLLHPTATSAWEDKPLVYSNTTLTWDTEQPEQVTRCYATGPGRPGAAVFQFDGRGFRPGLKSIHTYPVWSGPIWLLAVTRDIQGNV